MTVCANTSRRHSDEDGHEEPRRMKHNESWKCVRDKREREREQLNGRPDAKMQRTTHQRDCSTPRRHQEDIQEQDLSHALMRARKEASGQGKDTDSGASAHFSVHLPASSCFASSHLSKHSGPATWARDRGWADMEYDESYDQERGRRMDRTEQRAARTARRDRPRRPEWECWRCGGATS